MHGIYVKVVPPEVGDNNRMTELLETTQRTLQKESSNPTDKMKLIDTLQRLGVAYHFEEDIDSLLQGFSNGKPNENIEDDLFTTSLRFRLLRHNGYHVTTGTYKSSLITLTIIVYLHSKLLFN